VTKNETGPITITVAKTAGFCFGVRNALRIAEEAAAAGKDGVRIRTYGPLIHNPQVIADLEQKGIFAISSVEEVQAGDKVIIRAHGVGEAIYRELEAKGAEVIDATCPYVRKIHRIVRERSQQGDHIIIVGDPHHPEVEGIRGWCLLPPYIYAGEQELLENPPEKDFSYTVVAQTTFNKIFFKKVIELLTKMGYNQHSCSTICTATAEHQAEALTLAAQSDVMLVIGGRHSSNTRKLYDLCRAQCHRTYYIERAEEATKDKINSDGRPLSVGITAGASTPDYIIQEVITRMSEVNVFEEMLNESLREIHSRDVVTGTVVQVTESEIVFNIGYKCDGTMTKYEFGGTDEPLTEQVKLGDKMEVLVIKVGDSEVLLSRRRLLQDRDYAELEAAMENKTVLQGVVADAFDKGINVQYKNSKIFIPAPLVDIRRVEDLSEFVGQEIEFRIIRMQRRRGWIRGDRRSVLAEARAQKREEVLSRIEVGARMTGTVRNITNYCAFVDLGGVDGMLHLSEMGWKVIRHPNQYVKVGDVIEVLVKAFDPETNRISLSTKFPEENPWLGAEEKYAVGNIVTGTVVRFADFGAFVELEKGIDALIHISHISRKFVKSPGDVLTIGQQIEAKVIDFDPEKKRISLSMRELEPEETAEASADEAPAEEAPIENAESTEE
jgi:4-hydroxy-3-methylbut-2-enyl diphosphate reductase